MPYLFTFREILNLAKRKSLEGLPKESISCPDISISIDTEGKKYGLISICILLFDTNTIVQAAIGLATAVITFRNKKF